MLQEPGGRQSRWVGAVELNFNRSLEPVWLQACQRGHVLVNPNCLSVIIKHLLCEEDVLFWWQSLASRLGE